MLLAIKVESSNVAAILSAISALVPPQQIEVYDLVQPPKSPADDGLEELARKVALAIRPKATKPMRREALQKLARGHDTFCDQGGEADPALRNAIGAISKDLRSVLLTKNRSSGSPFPARHAWRMEAIRAQSMMLLRWGPAYLNSSSPRGIFEARTAPSPVSKEHQSRDFSNSRIERDFDCASAEGR